MKSTAHHAARHRLARRQAVQIATQLPENEQDARLVLYYLAELVTWEAGLDLVEKAQPVLAAVT